MIIYDRAGLFAPLKIIFGCSRGRWLGSSARSGLPVGVIAGICAALLHYFQKPQCLFGAEKTCGLVHPAVYTWYFQISTFMLTFHSNMAYNRFWEARSRLQQIGQNLASTGTNFIVNTAHARLQLSRLDSGIEKDRRLRKIGIFEAKALHFLSLLSAVMTQYLLDASTEIELETIGGTTIYELEALARCNDQVTLIKTWMLEMAAVSFYGPDAILSDCLPPPIVARIWTDLTAAEAAFYECCKTEDTPFPFPYQQIIAILVAINCLSLPIVVAEYCEGTTYSAVVTFITTWSYISIYNATSKMEAPFGNRENDLPLIDAHIDTVHRLRGLLDRASARAVDDLLLFGHQHQDMAATGDVVAIPFINRRDVKMEEKTAFGLDGGWRNNYATRDEDIRQSSPWRPEVWNLWLPHPDDADTDDSGSVNLGMHDTVHIDPDGGEVQGYELPVRTSQLSESVQREDLGLEHAEKLPLQRTRMLQRTRHKKDWQ